MDNHRACLAKAGAAKFAVAITACLTMVPPIVIIEKNVSTRCPPFATTGAGWLRPQFSSSPAARDRRLRRRTGRGDAETHGRCAPPGC